MGGDLGEDLAQKVGDRRLMAALQLGMQVVDELDQLLMLVIHLGDAGVVGVLPPRLRPWLSPRSLRSRLANQKAAGLGAKIQRQALAGPKLDRELALVIEAVRAVGVAQARVERVFARRYGETLVDAGRAVLGEPASARRSRDRGARRRGRARSAPAGARARSGLPAACWERGRPALHA